MDANQYSGHHYHTAGSSSSQPQGNLNISQGHLHLVDDDDFDMIYFDDPEEVPFDELFVANNQSDAALIGNQSAMVGGTLNQSMFPSNQPNFDQFDVGSSGPYLNHAAPNQAFNPTAPAINQGNVPPAMMMNLGAANQTGATSNQNHMHSAMQNNINVYAHAGKTITDMVSEGTSGPFQGYFTSRQHRRELEAQYHQQQTAELAATIDPASLEDMPGNDEERLRHWRKQIVEAIKDFSDVVNKNRKINTLNEQGEVVKTVVVENTHVRRVRLLSMFETELLADIILEKIEKAHQGITGIAQWVEKGTWCLEQYPSFEARMVAVLDALRRNKSVAHGYIQVPATNRFVAAPKTELKGKDDNIVCNGDRGQILREATKTMGKKAKGRKAAGKKATGKKATGTEAAGTEPAGEEAASKEAARTEGAGH